MSRSAIIGGLLAAAVALAGCSAEHFYKVGGDALGKGQYDKAVANFQKAAAKEPKNEQYRQALDNARKQAAQYHVDQASRKIASRDLSGGLAELQAALRYAPDDPAARQVLADLQQRLKGLAARRAEALRLADAGLFDQAIDVMQQVLDENRTMPGGQQDIARIRVMAANNWVNQAQGRLNRNELEQAERDAQRALDYVPGFPPAVRVFQDVANRRQAEQLVQQAKAESAAGRFEAALTDLEQAARLHPGRADLPAMISSARQAICDRHIAAGRQLFTRGDFEGAIAAYQASKAILPGYGNVDALIGEAQGELVGRYRRAGDQAAANRQWGNALLQYLISDLIAPGSVRRTAIEQCTSQIRDRLDYRVGVLTGSSRQRFEFRDMIEAIQPAVIAHLLAVRPQTVAVLNPQQMQRVIADYRIGAGELFGPNAVATAQRLKGGVDGLVLIRLDDFSMNTQQAPATGTSRFQSGTRMADNPDFAAALANRDAAAANVNRAAADVGLWEQREQTLLHQPPSPARDRRLREVRRDLAAARVNLANTRNGLTQAEAALAAVPRRIRQPVFDDFTFPVVVHTKAARLTAHVQVIDANHGQSLMDEAFNAVVTATDNVVQPDPAHNVPADPLTLPDDASMVRQTAERAAAIAQFTAEGAVYRFSGRHLALAEAAVRAKRNDAAVEHYVDYLFAVPIATANTEQAFARLAELVPHNPKAVNLREALQARCGVLRTPLILPIKVEERDAMLWLTAMPGQPPPGIALPCRITAVAGRPIRTLPGLVALLNEQAPGANLAVDLTHAGRTVRAFFRVDRAVP